uniref:Malectin-like domain-containing protein n=1 Tax=Quercus lobata TaxID=97700 RepID=A0A7N2LNX2_QUELO
MHTTTYAQHCAVKIDSRGFRFISIDCGSNEDYTDEDTKIPYISDKGLIDTGIVKTVSSDSPANLPRFSKNLRSFPNGTRNCYTLRPEQGKNNNYLIRAIFVYGNYDEKNQIPEFDLHLGVNEWTTVNLTNAGPNGFYYDVIHVPLTDYIDVCLINTGRGVPFISSLELRLLDNSIYPTQGRALTKIRGYDVGRNSSDFSVRWEIKVVKQIVLMVICGVVLIKMIAYVPSMRTHEP